MKTSGGGVEQGMYEFVGKEKSSQGGSVEKKGGKEKK